MFLNHDSVILDAHSPDVLSELFPSHVVASVQKPSAIPHEVLVAGASIVFPPYTFRFSVFLDEIGGTSVSDSLSNDSVLVCLPYDWYGSQITFDSEPFAAAIAYLSLTPRRVFSRPDGASRSVFAPPLMRDDSVSAFFSTIDIGLGVNTELGFIFCGNDAWTDKSWSAENSLELSRVCSSLRKLLELNAETLGSAHLSIGSDGRCTFHGLYSLTPSQFLHHRESIVKSIEQQVGK